MRVDVEKYLIVGPESQRELFFSRVQALGVVEFINYREGLEENSYEVETFMHALHILRKRVSVKQVHASSDFRSSIVLAQSIVETNEVLERLFEERRFLEKEMARVYIFGDFSLSQLHEIERETQRKIQFFFTKQNKECEAIKREEVLYIGSRYELDYYIAINRESKSYEGLIEMQIERSYGELEVELAQINRKIDRFETDMAHLAHHKKFIHQGLIGALNNYHLNTSKERIENHLGGKLFTAYGWVAQNQVARLQRLADELALQVEPVRQEAEDRKPTYLENKGTGRLGEDLVSIYDVPSAHDRDPSRWVYWAFMVFFSMIISDAGYGLLLLLISLFLFFKFGKKGGLARRVITLSITLSIGCIVWGVLAASYFGIVLPPESKLRNLSLIDWMVDKKAEYVLRHRGSVYEELTKSYPALATMEDSKAFVGFSVVKAHGKKSYVVHEEFADHVMLELVLFIGTLHIMISLLRYADRNWAAFGWVIFMVGAYLYFPSLLRATSLIHYLFHVPPLRGAQLGLYILFAGLAIAFILALIQKRLAGLAEPMNAIQVFSDVMSYLRIYALSLAGVIMAGTFNEMGAKMPLIAGILIIFAGHTVNFVLAVLMGGLIHGLRLNFIEWYHYSFEGGGKSFNPLKKIIHK